MSLYIYFFNFLCYGFLCYYVSCYHFVLFRTMRRRDHDVVLVRRTIGLRCWEFGMGRGWEGGVSLQVTWGQGGQDHITPKEGHQVSKRE